MTFAAMGFSHALALLALPLAGLYFVYIYRRRGTGNARRVGTLFLLKNLPRSAPPRKRFWPPLQFWIDLLVTSAVIAAAAGLYTRMPSHEVAIVLDNSFGMFASPGAASFFEKAQNAACDAIASAPSHAAFRVFTVAPSLRERTNGAEGKNEACGAIKTLRPTFAVENLQSAVEQLLKNTAIDGVWVFTDHDVALKESAALPSNLRWVPVRDAGEAGTANSALSSASIDPMFSTAVEATLRTFSGETTRGSLVLSIMKDAASGWTKHSSKPFEVRPASEQTIRFEEMPPSWNAARLEMELPSGTPDAIQEDNVAWLTQSGGQNSIVVVSPLELHELGLDTLKDRNFRRVGPTEYLRTARDIDAPLVLHRTESVAKPRRSAILIYPPDGNAAPVVRVSGEIAAPHPTRWLESHPITSYLNFPALTPPTAKRFAPLPGATTVVNSETGPLLVTRDDGGIRTAAVAFEIFPFEGPKSPTVSILTLNLFKWVFGHASGAGSLPVFAELNASAAPAYVETSRDSDFIPGSSAQKVLATRPGIVRSASGFAAINFFSSEESDTWAPRKMLLDVHEPPARGTDDLTKTSSKATLLALVALVLLCLDLGRRLLHMRRGRAL